MISFAGVLPKYFKSEWSMAQFRLHEGSQYIVAFGHQKNTIVILGMDGRYVNIRKQNRLLCANLLYLSRTCSRCIRWTNTVHVDFRSLFKKAETRKFTESRSLLTFFGKLKKFNLNRVLEKSCLIFSFIFCYHLVL